MFRVVLQGLVLGYYDGITGLVTEPIRAGKDKVSA